MGHRRQHAGPDRRSAVVHRRGVPAQVCVRTCARSGRAALERGRCRRDRVADRRLALARATWRVCHDPAGRRRRSALPDGLCCAQALRRLAAVGDNHSAAADRRAVGLACDHAERHRPCGAGHRRRLPGTDTHLYQFRRPCPAVLVLRGAQRRGIRHGLVQGLAQSQSAGLRLYVHRRHALGRDPISAGRFRDHRAFPDPVFPVLCRHRRPLCTATDSRVAQSCRRHAGVRDTADCRRAAKRDGARHAFRHGLERACGVRTLSDPGTRAVLAARRRHAPARRIIHGPWRDLRDAGDPAGA